MAIYLLGGHQTDFARAWSREGLDYTDMMREAIDGALDACRLEPDDIDAIHVGNAFGELYRGPGSSGRDGVAGQARISRQAGHAA